MSLATQCKKRIDDGVVQERGDGSHVERMLVWIRRMIVRLFECLVCMQKIGDTT
jgi:hypothetical protein